MSTPKLTGYQVVSPAYGRDYSTSKDAREAFLAGKDFILHRPSGSTYCSIRDFAPGASAQIRFNQLTQLTMVEVGHPRNG